MAEQPLPGIGRRHGPPAAGTVQELQAGGALERRDLLADRGLRVAELRSRSTERPRLDDRLERRQVADLDARQAIMFCDR